jgi:maltose-binding protein MalE
MKFLWAQLLVAGCLLGSGCQRSDRELILWHAYSGDERRALELVIASYNRRHPQTQLLAVAVPYAGMADKLASAIPNGNGPDLFIYPHDRLGAWVDDGTIEPIEFFSTDAVLQRFEPMALAAMTYRGSLWGLPLAVKTEAMFVRTDRFAISPTTMRTLRDQRATTQPRGDYALGYVNADLYGHAPILHAFGGRTVDDNDHLAIDSVAAVQAAQLARALVAEHTCPENLDGPTLAGLFNSGKVYAAFSGPWFVADIAADVPWTVATFPWRRRSRDVGQNHQKSRSLRRDERTHRR